MSSRIIVATFSLSRCTPACFPREQQAARLYAQELSACPLMDLQVCAGSITRNWLNYLRMADG
jgi:hypothetical protein